MSTFELIVAILGSSTVSSLGTMLIQSIRDRKKTRVETEQMTADVMNKVIASVEDQMARTKSQMNDLVLAAQADKKKIEELEDELSQIETRHEDCEFNNSMLLIELEGLRRMIAEKTLNIDKIKVAILDDSKVVTYIFEHRLKQVSLLDVSVFNDVDEFMKKIEERPDILIMDYHLGRGVTIEAFLSKIMEQKDYNPKIVVITADKSAAIRDAMSKLGVWRFFVKEGPYVNLVTKQVMDYIENRLK